MSDYVIGDVQGCYEPLQRLLALIQFNEHTDCLWFVGDLVNRGPDSLAVLRFIHNLPIAPKITLGNHDLHLLSLLFTETPAKPGKDDSLMEIVNAPDGKELGHWLRQQAILYYSKEFNTVMCHAGIAPMWDLPKALALAQELQQVLSGKGYKSFLTQMYGNQPSLWSEELKGMERLRCITNYFTRMRFCDEKGQLNLQYKGTLADAPPKLYPWYAVPNRIEIVPDLVFGHWAALEGKCPHPRIFALDTGCVWGRSLTALRLQDKQRFSVPGLKR